MKIKSELKMYLIPCSCGYTFSVSASYDKQGTSISRYIPCPRCGKRHDPKNRLLQMGYEARRFWTIKDC